MLSVILHELTICQVKSLVLIHSACPYKYYAPKYSQTSSHQLDQFSFHLVCKFFSVLQLDAGKHLIYQFSWRSMPSISLGYHELIQLCLFLHHLSKYFRLHIYTNSMVSGHDHTYCISLLCGQHGQSFSIKKSFLFHLYVCTIFAGTVVQSSLMVSRMRSFKFLPVVLLISLAFSCLTDAQYAPVGFFPTFQFPEGMNDTAYQTVTTKQTEEPPRVLIKNLNIQASYLHHNYNSIIFMFTTSICRLKEYALIQKHE